MVKIGMLFSLASWKMSLASISGLIVDSIGNDDDCLGARGKGGRRHQDVVHGDFEASSRFVPSPG